MSEIKPVRAVCRVNIFESGAAGIAINALDAVSKGKWIDGFRDFIGTHKFHAIIAPADTYEVVKKEEYEKLMRRSEAYLMTMPTINAILDGPGVWVPFPDGCLGNYTQFGHIHTDSRTTQNDAMRCASCKARLSCPFDKEGADDGR